MVLMNQKKQKRKEKKTNQQKNAIKTQMESHYLVHGRCINSKKEWIRNALPPALPAQEKTIMVQISERETRACTILRPGQHVVELNPSQWGWADAKMIQTLVADLATQGRAEKQVIILHDADRLTGPAQEGLRRLVEKSSATCCFILVAENISGLHRALKSRFLAIRIPTAMKKNEQKESYTYITERVLALLKLDHQQQRKHEIRLLRRPIQELLTEFSVAHILTTFLNRCQKKEAVALAAKWEHKSLLRGTMDTVIIESFLLDLCLLNKQQ